MNYIKALSGALVGAIVGFGALYVFIEIFGILIQPLILIQSVAILMGVTLFAPYYKRLSLRIPVSLIAMITFLYTEYSLYLKSEYLTYVPESTILLETKQVIFFMMHNNWQSSLVGFLSMLVPILIYLKK